MTHIISQNDDHLRRMAAHGTTNPATVAHKEVIDGLMNDERAVEKGRIRKATALQRLDEAEARVAGFRKIAKFKWEHESADELTGMITRLRRKFGDDPIAELAVGKITADEARKRGVDLS